MLYNTFLTVSAFTKVTLIKVILRSNKCMVHTYVHEPNFYVNKP